MAIDTYDSLLPALLAGNASECRDFLLARRALDSGSAHYWHWVAQYQFRTGEFLAGLDTCFRLNRMGGWSMHLHCMADMAVHLGLKEVGRAGLNALMSQFEGDQNLSVLGQAYASHYLGDDEQVISLPQAEAEETKRLVDYYKSKSLLRSSNLEQGASLMASRYCNQSALALLFPDQNATTYWHGQKGLPRSLLIRAISCGYGDLINWLRYVPGLRFLGVDVRIDEGTFGRQLQLPEVESPEMLEQGRMLADAGFGRTASDDEMWTEPFALFSALFPILRYAPFRRYLTPIADGAVDDLVADIRRRAAGRPCIALFWSSNESNNLFAGRSCRLEDLAPLWEQAPHIHWVVLQRGFEARRWAEQAGECRADSTSFPGPHWNLAQTISIMEKLDGAVMNDSVMCHAVGALGKPGYLFLNQVAEWRHGTSPNHTPWYPSLRVERAPALGDWKSVMFAIGSRLRVGF